MKRRTKIIAGIVLLIAIIIIIGLVSQRGEEKPETAQPQRQDIVQTVEFTGRVQAEQMARLGFETTGVVQQLTLEVGDVVTQGQRLATLDARLGELELAQAFAARVSAVDDTRVALEAARSSATLTAAENARQLESARQAVRNSQQELEQAKKVWQQAVVEDGEEATLTQARYSSVVAAESAYKSTQATLKNLEKTVAKSNDTTQAAVTVAETNYAQTQRASASAAGLPALTAAEHIAGVRLAKYALTSPFLGVVTEKTVETGEIAVAGSPIITIQTVDQTEVTALVTETDMTKLSVGLHGTVTLEAYPGDKQWNVEVAAIDPAAELIEGVPTYAVTLRFLTSDPQLRPGLTANVTLNIAQKNQVLTIPRRAVRTSGGKSVVTLLKSDETSEEREITTGIVGSDGEIEVLSGLTETDRVVVRQAS
ncbi:MAG: efflux RND transporter periplasmic adaptor subunit [Candidatus Andersenbacteria bacterium]